MSRTTYIIAAMAMAAAQLTTEAWAQSQDGCGDIKGGIRAHFDESAPQRIMPTRFGGRSRRWREEAVAEATNMAPTPNDTLALHTAAGGAQPYNISRYPMPFGGWGSWGLHSGLNVQLGASVFAQFGKGARGGAGFQQNIALMYAMPVTDKLSVAVGGYLNNTNYGGDNWRDAGLQAVVGYRFNEHWEAYVYGQKSITNNIGQRLSRALYDGYYSPGYYGPGMGAFGGFSRNFFGMPSYSAYDLSGIGDRIGATVRYNFNNNMSIEVSVENRWIPSAR